MENFALTNVHSHYSQYSLFLLDYHLFLFVLMYHCFTPELYVIQLKHYL